MSNPSVFSIVDQSGVFAVQERGETVGHLWSYLLITVAIGLTIYAVRQRWWQLMIAPVLLLWLAYGSYTAGRGELLKMQLDRNARTLSFEDDSVGSSKSVTTLRLADIASADFEQNRDAKRIVITLRDSRHYYPLGEGYLQGQDDEYRILNAIREAIGQVAPGPDDHH